MSCEKSANGIVAPIDWGESPFLNMRKQPNLVHLSVQQKPVFTGSSRKVGNGIPEYLRKMLSLNHEGSITGFQLVLTC